MHEVRGLTVSPASGARVATLQGIQEALPVMCGAPGLDWPRGDLQSNRLCPQLACLPRPAVPLLPGSFPLVLFCLCTRGAQLPCLSVPHLSSQPSLQCCCYRGATGAWGETPCTPTRPHRGRVLPSGDVSALHTPGPSRGPVSQDDASSRPPFKPTLLLPGPGPPALL